MNLAHLHLLLNHLPVLGIPFVLILYGVGAARKSDEIKRLSYYFAVAIALATIPAYLTGEPAEKLVKHLPGVTEAFIEPHEEAAELSLILVLISGALATLTIFMRDSKIVRFLAMGFVAGLIAATGVLAYTANRGGQIRHTEIRSDAASAAQTSTQEQKEGHEDHDD